MKEINKIIVIIMALCAGNILSAANTPKDSLWNDAVNAYTGGSYDVAIRSFSQLERDGYSSAELFYNIGNAYYNSEDGLAKSILYYHRALRLNPSFEDAKINLEMVKEFTQDRIDVVPEFILITWVKDLRNIMSTNSWAYLSILFFFLMALFILIFRYSGRRIFRKLGFMLAILSLSISIFSFSFSLALNYHLNREDEAIIMASVVSIRSSPNANATSLFNLHEGTKINILEILGTWSKVEIEDGRQGWIEMTKYNVI